MGIICHKHISKFCSKHPLFRDILLYNCDWRRGLIGDRSYWVPTFVIKNTYASLTERHIRKIALTTAYLVFSDLSSRNRTQDLWIGSQELRPLDHIVGLLHVTIFKELSSRYDRNLCTFPVKSLCFLLQYVANLYYNVPAWNFVKFQSGVLEQFWHKAYVFCYIWNLSGTKSTIAAAMYWPILPALDDRWWWWWLWSN
jgi:hypothetical protein